MADLYANFATTTLAGGAGGVGTVLGSGDATLYVSGGTGGLFPSPSASLGQQVRLTISNSSVQAQPEILYATGRSGDTFTGLARGQEGTTAPASWPANGATTITLDVTAGALQALAYSRTFYPEAYGVTGGTSDQTAINAAVSAAVAAGGGGVVQLGNIRYGTSGTILINGSNIILRGAGWGTIIHPAGSNFDVIAPTIPGTQTTHEQDGVWIEDIAFQCGSLSATTRGTGNAIHMWGWVSSGVRRCRFTTVPCFAVCGEGSSNSGYNVTVESCLTDTDCGGGVAMFNSCEADFIHGNSFSGAQTSVPATQPSFGTRTITAGYTLYLDVGVCMVLGNVFGNGGNTTNEAVHLDNSLNKFIGNKLDGCRYQGVIAYGDHHIILGNEFNNCSSVGTVEALRLGGTGYHNASHNTFHASSGGSAHYTYAITESGNPANDVIESNVLDAGTSGQLQLGTGLPRVASNMGYNPVGHAVAQPGVPASGTAYTNASGVSCMVYVTCGAGVSVSAVAIGGTATGISIAASTTGGPVRIPPGQSITLTYAGGTPSWSWFGD